MTKDAAVAFGDDAEMDDLFVGEIKPQIGCLDRVDIPDEVGDAYVRRRQFFTITVAAMQPAYRRLIPAGGDQVTRKFRNRSERVVIDFASRHIRDIFIQQLHHLPGHPRFCLPAQTQEQDIVPR